MYCSTSLPFPLSLIRLYVLCFILFTCIFSHTHPLLSTTISRHTLNTQQSISSQFESDEFEDSQRDKLSSTPLTAPSTTTVATPIPSPDTRVAVTKYKCFGSDVTLFTVVAVWNSQRSSLAMHYTDFREFDETMRHVMNVSPLVRDMPILIRPADFNSTLQLFKIWCVGKDEAAHSELKGLSDADSKAILQLSALNSYIVTVGALVDRTPYLEAFLELLDVLPDKAETSEGSHSNALNTAKPTPSKLPNTRASI